MKVIQCSKAFADNWCIIQNRNRRRPIAHNESRHAIVRVLNIVLVSILRFYQRAISPHIPPTCRYTPTCSQYAVEALQKYGPLKGTYRAVMRILRCTPFHKGGYDPVR